MATVYKEIYVLGKKLPKPDKLGIHTTLQNKILLAFESTVSAAFGEVKIKSSYLEKTRTHLEISKYLLRTERELNVITEKSYIRIAGLLVEASKMNTAWIKNTEERLLLLKTKNSLF